MKKVRIIALVCILAIVMIFDAYVGDYYRCEDDVAAVQSTNSVKVSKADDYWLFDGPGSKDAIVFYPGAKVQAESYAGIMRILAESGIDCFLVKMPMNMAFFGLSKALKIESDYQYDKWYIVGHSLGGAMAASFAEKNPQAVDGLILLAAYSANDISQEDFPVLSIYGSEDQVLNMDKVEEGRELVPDAYMEEVIEGGNHAGFGNYGPQKGDGKAQIDAELQQEETCRIIADFVETFSYR